MLPNQLVLRCYAERGNGYWQAFCIDLCLAVQGETAEECRGKMHSQIADYIFDIFEGDDKRFAYQLLARRAPLCQVVKFHVLKFLASPQKKKAGVGRYLLFNEIMPLKLAV